MQIDMSSTQLKKLLMFLLITSSFVIKAENLALQELESWEKNIIQISNSSGNFHKFEVYIADTKSKRKTVVTLALKFESDYGWFRRH